MLGVRINGDSAAKAMVARNSIAGGSAETRLLQQCRQCAESHLQACSKDVFDKADDLLFQRSNSGAADAANYFNALRDLRLMRPDIERKYLARFAEQYTKRLQHKSILTAKQNAPALTGGGLSLVDETELEESLAIEGLVGKSKERFRNQLHALTQRYQIIVSDGEMQEDLHPLAPDVICHAFRDAFDGASIEIAIKLVLYKLFEQYTLKNLGALYDDVNTLLLNAGILPQLKAGMPDRNTAGNVVISSADTAPVVPTPASPPPQGAPTLMGEAQADVYQTLQRLMSAKKFGTAPLAPERQAGMPDLGDCLGDAVGGHPGAGYAAGPPLPASALLQGLSLLQHLPPSSDLAAGESSIAYIKASLLQQLGDAGAGKALDPVHDNTIDVIGMIFEFILDEPSIPDVVKRLLNQLQIPILKVAIVEKEFFTNKQHPARRLLNTLGHASIGWNDKDATTQQRRFEQMEYIVERVLKEYQTDPGIFAELLESLTDFLATEGDEIIEEKPAEFGAEEAVTSEQRAFEAVALRLESTDLPRPVREFLRDVWQRVMVHVAAEQGVDGELWKRRYQTLDDLLWSVEPKKSGDDRRRMVALLPRLLGALQDGMQAVGCEQREIDAILNAFQPIHMACLRGEAPPTDLSLSHRAKQATASHEVTEMVRALQQTLKSGNKTSGDADFELKLTQEAESAFVSDDSLEPHQFASLTDDQLLVEDEFTDKARALAMGTWLEFTGGERRRGKLGWKSTVLGQYVFVDRRYKVVVEKTLPELAADFRSGYASMIKNIGMFDRALDKILNGLMAGAAAK